MLSKKAEHAGNGRPHLAGTLLPALPPQQPSEEKPAVGRPRPMLPGAVLPLARQLAPPPAPLTLPPTPSGPTPTPGTDLSSRGGSSAPSSVRAGLDSKALIPEHVDAEVSERYAIDSKVLGAGGYGRVFLATDREAGNRQVAIKKMLIRDGDMRERFHKEVLIMKDLDHPNVCKVFESYDEGRSVYLVMEYCEGGELFDRILDEEALSEQMSADIVGQVAGALKYAHGRGIAHRDLKPENVCFCSQEPSDTHVKVIDWGVGFYFGLRRMRTSVGSASYSAPEVLESSGCYTAACDLWSLGVLTYTMLCGRPPFEGNVIQQLQQMHAEPLPLSCPLWDAASCEAQDFVAGLLRSDPGQRRGVDEVLAHPWLASKDHHSDAAATERILANMRNFSKGSTFFSLCAATVARQLDHRSLQELRRAFRDMDSNGDGVLEAHEVRAAFERIFGKGSPQLHDVDAVFSQLDLDGSGVVDYTEFCAAGLGERVNSEVDALRAAFKAFDVQDGDGRLTKAEIVQVLRSADVGKARSLEMCEEMAEEILERFDRDGNGWLDFDEWVGLMQESSSAASGSAKTRERSPTPNTRQSCEAAKIEEQSAPAEEEGVVAWGVWSALLTVFGNCGSRSDKVPCFAFLQQA